MEQLFTAKRQRIEAEIVTTNRSREFLPEPHSPKDLDSRPSTSSPVPAALVQAGQAFARMTKLDASRRARAVYPSPTGTCPRSSRGLVPGPSGGAGTQRWDFTMSSRDKGERTNDCGEKRKSKKRKSGLSVIDEGQATSDMLFVHISPDFQQDLAYCNAMRIGIKP